PDRVDVVHAPTPGATTDRLKRRPELRLRWKVGIGREVRSRRPLGELADPLDGVPFAVAVAHEADRALEPVAVDDDPDAVAFDDLADRASGQRLGRDVTDAGPGGHTGEARVCQHRDVLPE